MPPSILLRHLIGASVAPILNARDLALHLANQNVLNLRGGEVRRQFGRGDLVQTLRGHLGGQVLAQDGNHVLHHFGTLGGGRFAVLGVALGLGFLTDGAGLGQLGNHTFNNGLSGRVSDGVQGDGQGFLLGHLSHVVSLSGLCGFPSAFVIIL